MEVKFCFADFESIKFYSWKVAYNYIKYLICKILSLRSHYKNPVLNPSHISTDRDLVTYFYQQEMQYHKKNPREVHLCIKEHFGTNATTKQLYSLIKEKKSNGILKSINRKLMLNTRIGILMKNTLMAMSQITSYFMDLIKDIIFISFFFKFLPSRFSIYIFECNLFFLLCFSVSLPGDHYRF